MKVCIELDLDTAKLLSVLASSSVYLGTPGELQIGSIKERAIAVLEHLASSAADGVRRPGAWERAWVEQAFGSWAEELLETDPDAPWRRRPAAGGAP